MKTRNFSLIIGLIMLISLIPISASAKVKLNSAVGTKMAFIIVPKPELSKASGTMNLHTRGNSTREAAIIVCSRAYEKYMNK